MILWIICKNKIKKEDFTKVGVKEVGQKALGLCRVPRAWTLPFFIITKEMFVEVSGSEKQERGMKIKEYLGNILLAVDELALGEKLIIRSSGEEEGMVERGKYDSIIVNKESIEEKLLELIEVLLQNEELTEAGMPLVVQKYAGDSLVGHISNERRFSKENRDFVYEYCEEGKKIETGRISLRNWRKKYDLKEYVNQSLDISEVLIESLKIVCAHFYYSKIRIHIEFVCAYNRFYIVQCDEEAKNEKAVNPEKYDVKMFENEEKFMPRVLRKIQDSDKGKYKKINNVFIYKEVDIEIPPLYILDSEQCINDLKNGNLSKELEEDLRFMIKQSLVIRTNIISDEKLKTQLSLRSNELRDYDSVKEFLLEAPQKLEVEGVEKYIFIFHNFIPAKIAAFVNAKPLERIVEIQSLWGLPEGLYYNAHDRITIDTKTISIDKINQDKFSIIKNEVYKENFIAPDEEGMWIVKKLAPPYDWKCTIENDNILKDMAYKARRITEKVGKELSIMWFVGIDEEFYQSDNIPWYHEEYDRNNYCYASQSNIRKQYKKKYFYEEEITIEKSEDLDKIKAIDSREIGLVRIQPKEDSILRSKEFINDVGVLCKEKGATIFLEGAVLAHSFYQLVETGAMVLVAHEIRQYEDKIEYNKLVRDYIPRIIRENGENVFCAIINGVGLIREIKNKIIEEAYEAIAADNKSDKLEELADLEEVCITFEKNLALVTKDKNVESREINNDIQIFFEGAVIEEYKQEMSGKMKDFVSTMKRTGSNIQVDFIFGTGRLNHNNSKPLFYENSIERNILDNAFQLLFTSDPHECRKIINMIRKASIEIREKYNCSYDEFEKIRLKKKEKRGGFEKGYVLLKTDFLREDKKEYLFEGILDIKSEPVDIYELPLKSRVDVENLNSEQLLIRITCPIYTRKTSWLVSNVKINNFLKRDVKIKITKKFEGTQICFGINYIEDEYKQLKLEFN